MVQITKCFGFNYFTVFISHSPGRQIDLLFTGSREILIDEKDVLDCIKILLVNFKDTRQAKMYLNTCINMFCKKLTSTMKAFS